jgi:hypothetical protein
MTAAGLLAGVAVAVALVGTALLALPAIRRTGLGIVHPSLAWLVLHAVFFGAGAAILAAAGAIAPGPAWYTAGAAAAVGLGVAGSDLLARRRGAGSAARGPGVAVGAADPAPARPVAVVALVALALAAIAPGLLATGLPLLSDDPTGARLELAGFLVQPLRIALPGAAVVAVLAAARTPSRQRIGIAVVAVGLAVTFTLLLASRYLAAELVAALVVGWLLAGRRIPARAVAAIGIAVVLAFGAVQVVRAPELSTGRELVFAIERTISRVIFVQPRTLDALMEVIPAEEPFFGGLTWFRRLGPALGHEEIPNLGYWIYPEVFPDQDPAIPGYAAPGLIGEAWANFGVLGLALFLGLGVVLERLGALLARRRAGTGDVAAGALAVVVLARTHALGLSGALQLVALVVAWRLLAAGGTRDLAIDAAAVVRWRA